MSRICPRGNAFQGYTPGYNSGTRSVSLCPRACACFNFFGYMRTTNQGHNMTPVLGTLTLTSSTLCFPSLNKPCTCFSSQTPCLLLPYARSPLPHCHQYSSIVSRFSSLLHGCSRKNFISFVKVFCQEWAIHRSSHLCYANESDLSHASYSNFLEVTRYAQNFTPFSLYARLRKNHKHPLRTPIRATTGAVRIVICASVANSGLNPI